MASIKDDIYLGNPEKYNNKLELLAKMAQPEVWTYKKIKEKDPYRILRNYIDFTYCKLKSENKLLLSENEDFLCMNTGLLTVYNQEIVALFAKNNRPDLQPWFLTGFFKESDKAFTAYFSEVPQLADYFDNVADLVYDSKLDISLKKEHIIDDNLDRFIEAGYTDKQLINYMLDSTKVILEKKLRRNFKLALPFNYHDTKSGEYKIQLLAPLYLPGAPVRLALVLNKIKSDVNAYYEGVTVLPVEWAYMNARLIAKPDEEWANIIEEINCAGESDSATDGLDICD